MSVIDYQILLIRGKLGCVGDFLEGLFRGSALCHFGSSDIGVSGGLRSNALCGSDFAARLADRKIYNAVTGLTAAGAAAALTAAGGGRIRQSLAEGCYRGSSLADNAVLGLGSGIITPDAEHRAARVTYCTAGESGFIKSGCFFSAALGISFAENPIVTAIGIDERKALALEAACRHRGIAAPAV